MCDFTSGMAVLGAATSVAGNVMGLNAKGAAADAKAEGYYSQALQDRQAANLQSEQAQLERNAGGYQQARKVQDLDRLRARQTVATAGSGFTLDGSPTDVIADSASQGDLDVQAIQYATDIKSRNSILRADAYTQKSYDDLDAMQKEYASKPGFMDYALGIGSGISGLAKSDSFMKNAKTFISGFSF